MHVEIAEMDLACMPMNIDGFVSISVVALEHNYEAEIFEVGSSGAFEGKFFTVEVSPM